MTPATASVLADIEGKLQAILDAKTITKNEMRGRILEAWGIARRAQAAIPAPPRTSTF